MRPHKKILVFGLSADELGELGYVLRLRHYDVTLVITGEAAMQAIAAWSFDCAVVLGSRGLPVCEAVVLALSGARTEMPIVLAVPRGTEVSTAATVVCHGLEMNRVLEAIRLLVRRKRGPKKPGEMRVDAGSLRALAATV